MSHHKRMLRRLLYIPLYGNIVLLRADCAGYYLITPGYVPDTHKSRGSLGKVSPFSDRL